MSGRYLQVIYVFRMDEDLDYDSIDFEAMISVSDDDLPNYYVVHARELTEGEKRKLRRRSKP